MILKTKNDRLNYLIKTYLVPNENLRALDPIIAGGSILFCYLVERSCAEPFQWRLLEKNLKRKNIRSVGGLIGGDFSDIDYWFLEDSIVHSNPDSREHLLIKKYVEGGGGVFQRYMKDAQLSLTIEALGLSELINSTGWANTFSPSISRDSPKSMKDVSQQFMRTPAKSVEDLISGFDFVNCMIGWKDDELYYDSELLSCFNDGVLRLNSNDIYNEGTLPSRVFNALRAFKYSRRYGLDFSQELAGHIFNVFYEAKDVDFDAYKEKMEYIRSAYGLRRSTAKVFRGMVASLEGMFDEFTKMKSFKEEYAIFLIDRADSLKGLKDYLGESAPSADYDSIPF
jgi:hypothetical protein